ncbi:hypothetical protein WA026_013840 [Henosepilachna vigintioctopunctata]|uniref:RING-type domain-containing protein n=1 Tax=Henosepilachna vigintioctopunctata TaxID=420089 RepID=A0AAW1US51_9CUCU
MTMEMNDVMYSLVECHICLEDMTGKIMSCRNGHIMCDNCYAKLKPFLCPFCKIPMENIRNIPLEKFLKKLSNKHLSELLDDSLTLCSQCSQRMDTHVGTCPLGHNFCRNCNKDNSKCRICRSEVSIKRNFQVERCLQELKQLRTMQPKLLDFSNDSFTSKDQMICPLSKCSFTFHNLRNHILSDHESLIVTLELNNFYRLAVKPFTEKNIFLCVSQNLFIVRVRVIETFISISTEQINKGSEHNLYIQNCGKYPIGFYKFKYTNNGKNKKIILRKESIQLSKLGEYVLKISICNGRLSM